MFEKLPIATGKVTITGTEELICDLHTLLNGVFSNRKEKNNKCTMKMIITMTTSMTIKNKHNYRLKRTELQVTSALLYSLLF